jgi:hypothetical protein
MCRTLPPVDSAANRRAHPAGFKWSCCGQRGAPDIEGVARGCTPGPGPGINEKYAEEQEAEEDQEQQEEEDEGEQSEGEEEGEEADGDDCTFNAEDYAAYLEDGGEPEEDEDDVRWRLATHHPGELVVNHLPFSTGAGGYWDGWDERRAPTGNEDLGSGPQGRAVQLDPMKSTLKPPGFKRLKLECDMMLPTR